jgi:hypothetical protein
MNMNFWLEIVTVLFAGLAAFFWFCSAVVRAPYKDIVDKNGWTEASIISDGNDVIETIRKQSYWSAWAALAAVAAAICQAIVLISNTLAE